MGTTEIYFSCDFIKSTSNSCEAHSLRLHRKSKFRLMRILEPPATISLRCSRSEYTIEQTRVHLYVALLPSAVHVPAWPLRILVYFIVCPSVFYISGSTIFQVGIFYRILLLLEHIKLTIYDGILELQPTIIRL